MSLDDKLNGPELGDDIAAIRERVLRRQTGETGAEPKKGLDAAAQDEINKKLREAFQVDLDQEGAFDNLEDPVLVSHIAHQRRALAEYESTLKTIPSRGDLNLKYVEIISGIGALLKDLNRVVPVANDAGAMATTRAKDLASIVQKRTPRNAPQNPFHVFPEGAREFFAHFVAEAGKTAADSNENYLALKDAHQRLFVLRREVEFLGDNFLRLAKTLEDERRHYREFLREKK